MKAISYFERFRVVWRDEPIEGSDVMPYKSAKQRAYLHAKEPKLAAKWDRKYGTKIQKKKG